MTRFEFYPMTQFRVIHWRGARWLQLWDAINAAWREAGMLAD